MRENALCALMAGSGCATLAWLGLYGFGWNDYENEARPAFAALVHGQPLDFLRLAPAYGGSLIERAPFALVPGLWGGGALAIYRAVALPCLIASAALGVWLVARMRAERRPRLARALALAICVANPLTLRALELGHPEELLGACLCVAAVLLAGRDRPLWAALLLGLAVANKDWALLATGPVLLALPRGRRLRCVAAAAAVAALVLAPLMLVGSGGFTAATRASVAPSGTIFQPWQLWWFLGHHGALVHGLFGEAKPGYRIGPAWASTLGHPLIVLVGFALAACVWLRERRDGPTTLRTALLVLAFALLLRCVLDTWDAVYYPLPFVLALLAWEVTGARERLPVLALSSTVLAWVSFQWLPEHASPDVQAAFFLAWAVALAVALGRALFSPERAASERCLPRGALGASRSRAQEMTVRRLSRPLRTS